MRRIGHQEILQLALEAIEEATAAAHLGPVPRTRGLALALAWLLHFGKDGDPPPRWPFDSFWEGLATERGHDRWSAVNAAANGIYRALEVPRDRERISAFERRMRRLG
jgi:hypothetical protein